MEGKNGVSSITVVLPWMTSKILDYAPVAQLDRVRGYPGGREFESLRARQLLVWAQAIAAPPATAFLSEQTVPEFCRTCRYRPALSLQKFPPTPERSSGL